MERSFERGQSGKSSDKNQGRAGEVTRRLAEARQGKDSQEPSSPQSSETPQTHKESIDIHSPDVSLENAFRRLGIKEIKVKQNICKEVLSEKLLDIYENNNKHDRRTAIDFLEKERDKLVTYKRCTAIEFLEKEGNPLVAHKFVELLNDKRLGNDPKTQLRMISAIGRLKDPSVVPELLKTLSSNKYYPLEAYGAMAGVAVMLDRQVAVPKLIEMFRDYRKTKWNQRSIIALAIGMSGDQSAVQKLKELNFYRPFVNKDESHKMVEHAINVLEGPSVGKELVKVFSDQRMNASLLKDVLYVVGKLGDISVAHELVDMLSCYERDPYYTFDNIPKAVEEIGIRSGNSEEIKELSKKLLKVVYEDKYSLRIGTKQKICEAVSEFGKILPSEDAKELSKEFGAKLFDERILQECAPAIANAMFELELHRAEPDPLKRILDPGKVRREACENIKEEILQLRQDFIEDGKVSSKFYERLSKAAFSNDTRREMRIWVFRPIMKEAGSSFAPTLEKLYKSDRFITEEEWQKMREFAQYLRDHPSSSDAEHFPQ
jgi:hypothetical protein